MRKAHLIFVALVVSSCGSSSTSPAQPSTEVAATTSPFTGTSTCFQGLAPCASAATFDSTCASVGGAITNQFGPDVCEITRRYDYNSNLNLTLYYPNELPIITPSLPAGGIDTGIHLRVGARLSYFSVQSGKWGYQQSSSSWFSGNCQSIDWSGSGSNGQLKNEGEPSGLFGSDGTDSFYLGSGSQTTTLTIQNDGDLRLGINTNPSTPYGCTSPGLPVIDLTTCEDANGNTYSC